MGNPWKKCSNATVIWSSKNTRKMIELYDISSFEPLYWLALISHFRNDRFFLDYTIYSSQMLPTLWKFQTPLCKGGMDVFWSYTICHPQTLPTAWKFQSLSQMRYRYFLTCLWKSTSSFSSHFHIFPIQSTDDLLTTELLLCIGGLMAKETGGLPPGGIENCSNTGSPSACLL